MNEGYRLQSPFNRHQKSRGVGEILRDGIVHAGHPQLLLWFQDKISPPRRCAIDILELEDQVPFYQHFTVDVDGFHATYDAAKEMGALDSMAFRNPVNELPDGCVQMYMRDPAGNLIEIDWPDVETLDRSGIPEMKLLAEFTEQNEEGLAASLYLDRPHLKAARRAR